MGFLALPFIRNGFVLSPGNFLGFGLGFSIQTADSAEGSKGQYGWGGAASTYFWIDPQIDLICIFMTQFIPSYTYDIRNELRRLVYSDI